jgi:26S proteasome regulatory subunit N2
LLEDTQPEESKAVLEEKLKKVTTERAPVAGQQGGRGAGGAGGRGGARSLLDGLVDPSRVSTGNPVMDQLLRSQGRSPFNLTDSQAQGNETSGADAAAGVLTAVDEDQEGDEEAPKPDDFDYFTDSSDVE